MTSLLGVSSTQFLVQVEGVPLDPLVAGMLVSAEVESSLFLPAKFRLVFRGSRLEVLEMGGFQLGVMIDLQVTQDGAPVPLMSMAEVTAVEVDYAPESNLTIVTGMDKSHRLMAGTNTMAFPDMTASDVVTALAAIAEIPPGEVVPTENVYEWLTQANVSNWAFMRQLAELEGYDLYVNNLGLLCFKPPTEPEESLPPVLDYAEPAVATQLVMGANLVRLRGVVSAAGQVPETNALGWDPTLAMPAVGVAPALPTGSVSVDPAAEPVVVAGEFTATPFFETRRPLINEAMAETRALAVATEIASTFAELEGECLGNPEVMAGGTISLGMAGPPFDGMYVVSSARHVFEPGHGGYSTWFTAGGRRDSSLLALAGGHSSSSPGPCPSVPGVVTGTVVDNMDPEEMGRVKVMFPWMSDEYVSAWARMVQPGASNGGTGFLWLPEVGDEVLVSFDRGDVNCPYVIGNLYNGIARPIPPPEIDGVVSERRIMSQTRHMIEFNDGPEQLGINITTGDETVIIRMDAEAQALTVISAGAVTVEAAEAVSITAGGDLSIEVGGDLSIESGGAVSIVAGAAASVEATGDLSLQTEGAMTANGTDVTVTGEAAVTVMGAAIMLGG